MFLCIETIKNSKHRLLKINWLHCIPILWKSQKSQKLVSSLYNWAKNKLEMFVI